MKRFILFSCLLMLITACNTAEKKRILNYGKIENAHYTNEYFGISLTIPENWSVQSQQQTEAIVKEGNDLIKSNNETLAKELDLAAQQTVYLLTVFQYEVGTVKDFNPSFMLVAEKLPANGYTNPKEYLTQTGKVLQQTGQYTDIKDQFTKVDIGGKEFYALDAVMNLNTHTINQRFLATVMHDYALVLILTSNDNNHKAILQNIIPTIRFKP